MVVAVNQCDAGEQWSLDASKNDAIRFVNWLRANDVPPENISLFSGEKTKPDWVSGLGVEDWARADSTNIKEKLWNYRGESGDLLLIYWSGHGVLDDRDSDRRVFVSDMRPDRWDNLSIDKLANLLKRGGFPNLKKSVLFVDACSAVSSQPRQSIDLPDPPKRTVEFRALYSARQGDKAAAGFFGAILLPLLERQPWPPDFDSVISEVEAHCKQTSRHVYTVRSEAPDKDSTYSAGGSRGRLFHLYCDRTTPVGNFKRSAQALINGTIRSPLLCLVYGDEVHKPDSLVQRLIGEANDLKNTSCEAKPIVWDRMEEENIRSDLSFKFEKGFTPIDAKQFAGVLRSSTEPVIQIQHEIGMWSRKTQDVFDKYLHFWNELNKEEGLPPVLVFFSMEFMPLGWRHWIPWLARARRKLESALTSVQPAFHVKPADLDLITPEEVGKFIKMHCRFPPEKDLEVEVKKIFKNAKALPMKVIENELSRLMRAYA